MHSREGVASSRESLLESEQPDAVALVLWQDPSYLQVTVRVGRGNGQWVVRSLTFSDRDSISERWITIGLTVATLVGEGQSKRTETPAVAAVAPPRESAPPKAPDERTLTGFDLAGGALAGPGWDEGSPQFGGWLALGFGFASVPAALRAFGSYAVSRGPLIQGRELKTDWLTVGLSGAVVGTFHALDLRGSAALEVALRQVRVDLDGRTASAQEVPVRVRLFASYPSESRVALTAGTIVRLPPLSSEESDEAHLRGPLLAVELVGGVEVRL